MGRAGEIRASRLRTMLQHAPSVKSREELEDYAITRFGVTRYTASDYVDAIIKYVKKMEKNDRE